VAEIECILVFVLYCRPFPKNSSSRLMLIFVLLTSASEHAYSSPSKVLKPLRFDICREVYFYQNFPLKIQRTLC
jgi:hypothetical protein